jgi:hypothetical protein
VRTQMNTIQKRKHDLDPDLYVNLVNKWNSERPRRPHCNVIIFPAPVERNLKEEPDHAGFTGGGMVMILLSFLALTVVLIALGITP